MYDSRIGAIFIFWIRITLGENATDQKNESGDILYFDSGQTFSRTCWSYYESEWVLPENEQGAYMCTFRKNARTINLSIIHQYRKDDDERSEDDRLSLIETRTKNGWFKTKLLLRDLRYTDTGFYTCKAKLSIFDDMSNYSGNVPQLSRVYVVVASTNAKEIFLHRKDDRKNSYVRQVPVWKNRDSFVPCLSTRWKDVQVSLKIDGVMDQNYDYDLRYGFLIPANSLPFDDARSGRCLAQINSTESTESPKVVDRIQVLLIPIEHTDLAKPVIRLGSHLLYKNGELRMYCIYPGDPSKPENVFLNCSWSFPDRNGVKLIGTSASNKTLWIPKLEMSHSGNYTCTCRHVLDRDRQTMDIYYVDVLPTRGRIFYLAPAGPTAFVRAIGDSVHFAVRYRAWPNENVKLQWFYRRRDEFSKIEITEIINNPQSTFLRLNDLRVNATGVYVLRLTAGGDLQRDLLFSLLVYGQSNSTRVFITKSGTENFQEPVDGRFLEYGASYDLYCIAEGFPLPELRILWNPCARTTKRNFGCEWMDADQNIENVTTYEGDFQKSIRAVTLARKSGRYACQVMHIDNKANASFHPINYIVTDIDDSEMQKSLAINLITEDPSGGMYQSDTITAVCRYQPLIYSRVRWAILSHNRVWESLDIDRRGLISSDDPGALSSTKVLIFPNVQSRDVGTYSCLAKFTPDMGDEYELRRFKILINETVPLTFGNVTSPQVQTVTLGYPPVEIYCDAQGAPKPSIAWLKDNEPLETDNGTVIDRRIELLNKSRLLVIQRPRADDGGVYTCIAKNRFDIIHADFDIRISSVLVQSILSYWIIGLLATALALLAAVTIFLLVCLVRSRRIKKTTMTVRMNHLRQLYDDLISSIDEGMQLDPDQPVNEQTENLPYDPRFEISIDQLKIGQLLGEGQFGRVFEGALTDNRGIVISAAVKTPKVGTNPDQQKALLSEFKIMIYIENHVNVLRLLGGVTKHMVDGRLYIVMEHCRLGSLSDYLKKNRDHFIDELLPTSVSEEAYESSIDIEGYLVPNSTSGSSGDISRGGNGQKRYRAELDPSWSQKISANRQDENFVSTSDLLSYAYQVTNGMDYLASKKIIHRDLALRNILLNGNKIVKICDFGLARQDYAYFTTKVGIPLPVKWMAIESILYQEYTVKSDVWAFGVVVWEIFSLAQTPYPGQAVDRNFIRWLKVEENRMPRPEYAPENVYSIMRQCWLSIPDDRPDFSDCRRRIGKELFRCSSDYYKELLAITNPTDYAQSDLTFSPANVGSLLNFSQSHDDPTSAAVDESRDASDAVTNLSYFDYLPGHAEEMEMTPLNMRGCAR